MGEEDFKLASNLPTTFSKEELQNMMQLLAEGERLGHEREKSTSRSGSANTMFVFNFNRS